MGDKLEKPTETAEWCEECGVWLVDDEDFDIKETVKAIVTDIMNGDNELPGNNTTLP